MSKNLPVSPWSHWEIEVEFWAKKVSVSKTIYTLDHFYTFPNCSLSWVFLFHVVCIYWMIIILNEHRWGWLSVKLSANVYMEIIFTGFLIRGTRWMPLVEQELRTILEHISKPEIYNGNRVFYVTFCGPLFISLSISLPLYYLFFFNITPLVSSNFSFTGKSTGQCS